MVEYLFRKNFKNVQMADLKIEKYHSVLKIIIVLSAKNNSIVIVMYFDFKQKQ